jgi:hypothetical protein
MGRSAVTDEPGMRTIITPGKTPPSNNDITGGNAMAKLDEKIVLDRKIRILYLKMVMKKCTRCFQQSYTM